MSFTIPADSHTPLDGGHTADHNRIVDVLNGTGAVYNVLNTAYAGGADPTGGTDSTSAIQAAISALPASGGTVRLPAGTYTISSALQVGSNVTLLGDGPQTTIISQASTTADCIAVNGSGNVLFPRIAGLYLKGPNSGSGRGISVIANNGNSPVVGLAIRDVFIRYFGGVAADVQVAITSVLDNVQAWNCGSGFYLHGGGTSTTMSNCYANGCTAIGYNITGQSYTTLTGCASDSCGLGYQIGGGSCVALIGCGAESVVANGGQDGTSFKISGGIGHSLVSCYCTQNNAVGFWVTASAVQASLIGCRENSPAGGATASVKTDTGTLSNLFGISTVTARALTASTYGLMADASANWTLAGTGNVAGLSCSGNMDVAQTGNGLRVAEGSNAKQGTTALVAGTKVVANTAVTASSRIFLTSNADGGTPGWLRVSARTAGTSFTITSSSGTDTSTVAYEIFEPG